MTGAFESEWSRGRDLGIFLFICFRGTVSDTPVPVCACQQMLVLPPLYQPSVLLNLSS